MAACNAQREPYQRHLTQLLGLWTQTRVGKAPVWSLLRVGKCRRHMPASAHLDNVAQLHASLEDALQERALAGADVALHAQRNPALGVGQRRRRRFAVRVHLRQVPHDVLAVLPPDPHVCLRSQRGAALVR